MEAMRAREQYDMVCLMVTDIINEATHLLSVGKAKLILKKAFGLEDTDSVLYLPGVMSRKKQVVPLLIEAAREEQ